MLKKRLKVKYKRKKKVIFIYGRNYDSYFPEKDDKYFYLAGHAGYIARKFKQQFPDYDVENWRCDKFVDGVMTKNVENVTCKIFPSKKVPFLNEFSYKLFQNLKDEIKNHNIIIHHSGLHNRRLWLLIFAFPKTPIVATQFGDVSPFLKKKNNKLKIIANHIEKLIGVFFTRKLKHIFVASNKEISLLKYKYKIQEDKISFPEIGTDLNLFKQMDKNDCRRKLNLPVNSKILLYIGRFDAQKGLDIILEILLVLKKKYNDLRIILIGYRKNDKYLDYVKKIKIAYYYSYIPYEELPYYHNASDVFVKPVFNKVGANSVGANIIETLCCDTPVCSPSLKQIPFNGIFGEIPKDKSDFFKKIVKILDNPNNYLNCGSKIREVYGWNSYLKIIEKAYQKLFKKYYGKS